MKTGHTIASNSTLQAFKTLEGFYVELTFPKFGTLEKLKAKSLGR